MRVIFMGTGEFAIPSLEILIKDGYEVVAVITQPDRAKDRKGNITDGVLKKFAMDSKLKVCQFEKIGIHCDEIKQFKPDFMVTASYGQILSKEILEIAPIYNVHASLLPKYRGSSPMRWAIINGDKETGVTIMRTEIGLDTGDIYAVCKTPIAENETYGELFDKLKIQGANLLSQTLKKIRENLIVPIKQDEKNATKCSMITRDVCEIDWTKPNNEINNLIRAMNPKPGAFTTINGEILKIYNAEVVDGESIGFGKMLLNGKQILIGCGIGNLDIKKLQLAGKREMSAEEFINGNKGKNGIVCAKRSN